MDHQGLFTTLVAAIVLAFIFGFIARRVGLSPIVGFLLAGLAVGPYTPGFVGDTGLAMQLAEIGVVLLMFGVGLKFSLEDLMAVRGIALPGALVQMAAATALGFGFGKLVGMSDAESFLLGFSLSVASTVVLLRALEERGLVKSENGRICVGWLVIEDIAIVLGIVVLPAVIGALQGQDATSGGGDPVALTLALGLTLGKIALFVALMLVIGARFFPWFITRVAHLESRELLGLGTLAIALGIAYAAYEVFDASFALGAFLAGLALNGSKVSHRVAEDSLPLRDTFSVLFFVSVGMLLQPRIFIEAPLSILAVTAIIVVGKGLAALAIALAFKQPLATAFLVAAALAQIGEFSFVLATMGRDLGIMGDRTYNLILAGAILSIALNPVLFALAARLGAKRAAPVLQPTPSQSS